MMHLWIGTLPSSLNEVYNSLEVCWILKNSEIVLKLRLGPDGYVSNVGLGQKVEELGDGSWEDVCDLGSSVTHL